MFKFNLFIFCLLLLAAPVVQAKKIPTSKSVVKIITKVNDYWQYHHPKHGKAFWDNAAYHTGNIAAYEVTGNQKYFDFSYAWAERNQWKGALSDNKDDWKYKYGETHDHVLFGDWQICFQTYIDLFNLTGGKDTAKIARALEVMEYQMSTDPVDYWWWADGLYMVMPVMTKLYRVTGKEVYLEKLQEYYNYAKSIMYDEATGLFFRDAKYLYPKHYTLNHEKDFWARGNGWVFAGLAKVLADLPANHPSRPQFENDYKKMALALKKEQMPGGFWTRSILDPDHAPGQETSGTAFFAYGFLWGINNDYLPEEEFLPIALNAWDYLVGSAIDKSGQVGYVQPILVKGLSRGRLSIRIQQPILG